MAQNDDPVLLPGEIAQRQRISVKSVLRALQSGALVGYKVGGNAQWRIRLSEYAKWCEQGCPTKPKGESDAD